MALGFRLRLPRGLQQTAIADEDAAFKCTYPWIRWFEELADLINQIIIGSAPVNTDFTSSFTAADGKFTVAHGLGYSPSSAVIAMASLGIVSFQYPLKWDATNFYLIGSDNGLHGTIVSWK